MFSLNVSPQRQLATNLTIGAVIGGVITAALFILNKYVPAAHHLLSNKVVSGLLLGAAVVYTLGFLSIECMRYYIKSRASAKS